MEARKVLVEELGSTLQTVAKDVKIQIEFNPEVVAEYRLIGYENRVLAREDFNNDKVDAGEIGAGHSVSALYEVTLAGSGGERIDPLRYGRSKPTPAAHSSEVATLRLRYKLPQEDRSKLVETIVRKESIVMNLQQNSDDYRFAAAVAAFGQTLRGGKYLEQFGYDEIISLARGSLGSDAGGYRSELLRLVALARDLGPVASTDQPMERAVAGGR
jgi:Ca-activated chloride channel family protein